MKADLFFPRTQYEKLILWCVIVELNSGMCFRLSSFCSRLTINDEGLQKCYVRSTTPLEIFFNCFITLLFLRDSWYTYSYHFLICGISRIFVFLRHSWRVRTCNKNYGICLCMEWWAIVSEALLWNTLSKILKYILTVAIFCILFVIFNCVHCKLTQMTIRFKSVHIVYYKFLLIWFNCHF